MMGMETQILQLAPLVRHFREQVEASEIPFEESMRTLFYASDLVLFKVRWLLPNAEIAEEEEEEIVVVDEPSLEAATVELPMEPYELVNAAALVTEAIRRGSAKFPRGFAPSFKDERRMVVTSIDPQEVRKALLNAEIRTGHRTRGVVLPRWNFVTHLRAFWSEVRRLTASGAVLRFSRFLGKTKMESILNFLAFLELIKRRRLYARQRSLFGEIVFSTDKNRITQEEAEPS